MKKGQTALEYLVTYGWAILAIVIIAGVLWYFGVFNPGKYAEERQCGGSERFSCLDYKVSSTGTLTIVLGNKAGGEVNITATLPSSTGCIGVSVPANGQTTCTAANFVSAGATGSSYEQTNFYINTTDVRTALTHTDTLFVKGKRE